MSRDETVPEHVAVLVSAHALGALEPDEADEAERWIARSEACRALFEEALETASWLAMATGDTEPPPALRERILDALRGEEANGPP